jgi:methionine transaminase
MIAPIVSRLPGVGTTIFTVMSELAARAGALNLSQGVPDFDPPAALVEHVVLHLRGKSNQYPPMAGVPRLREAIAADLQRRFARVVSPQAEVTITVGGTEGLTAAILACVGAGDEVIVFDPAYDSYEPIATLAGAQTIHVPLTRPDFAPDWERLAAALSPRTRLVIINTPHNPSGRCLTRAELDRLAEFLRPTRAMLLSDEVYEHMIFDGRAHESVHAHPELAERSFVVSSFGKTFHVTGWKVGYCVAPAALSSELRKVHQFLTFTVAKPLQEGLADFLEAEPGAAHGLSAFYQRLRDRLVDLLAGSRFSLRPTAATYFQLVDYSAISDEPDLEFTRRLALEHGVAAIPMSPFSPRAIPGERLIRLCFAKTDETLVAAAERLRRL